MAKKTRHILVMKNGREIPITGITGRYYITRESQYRKECMSSSLLLHLAK